MSRLKSLREDLGLSQRQMAREVGIPQSLLARLENDENPNISFSTGCKLARFASLHRTTIDFLLCFE